MNHRDQILALLEKQIGNASEVEDIRVTADEVARRWVKPLSGGREDTNGLIYGLVQSGKTGVLTVTAAIGADEGYKTIIILTSDNDPLYEQTLARARQAFPGIDIIGKREFKDADEFLQRVKGGTTAIVTTKNASRLGAIIQNFRAGNLKGLSALIIDDEADQASLNTRAARDDGSRSKINERIGELRTFFDKNTYLQVTATPQALFLQTPGHEFRPTFTVLSHPGAEYVGGDEFFGDQSALVREFPIGDLLALSPGSQPSPSTDIPRSLLRALDTFMIAATFKRLKDPEQNCAFLCHVSTRTSDHNHIVDLFRAYKRDLSKAVKAEQPAVRRRLREAFDDLAATSTRLTEGTFDELVEAIGFYSPGIAVKLVNGQTDEDVALASPYNLFVGGNKLGRGVTIRNLLVSYYGRHPRRPQADTVLQHARMYGYRRSDIGLLRLFLPQQLHVVFKAIHKMETGLRDLIASHPEEEFRGVFVESGVSPTRRNVLVPGAVGIYSGGSSYNPSQVRRDLQSARSTGAIDTALADVKDKTYVRMPIGKIAELVTMTRPDPEIAEQVWNSGAIAASIQQYASLKEQEEGYVYVDRDRGLRESRHETQGILEGGEVKRVPSDRVTLFILRTTPYGQKQAVWWPQVRFPSGQYAFAFSV